MELLVLLVIGLVIGSYAYQSGKRTGSRNGYIAGRRDRRLLPSP